MTFGQKVVKQKCRNPACKSSSAVSCRGLCIDCELNSMSNESRARKGKHHAPLKGKKAMQAIKKEMKQDGTTN